MSQQLVILLSDHVAGSVAAKDWPAFVAGRHDGGREHSAQAPAAHGPGGSTAGLCRPARGPGTESESACPSRIRDGGPSWPPSASHLSARAELCKVFARDNMHIRSLHHDQATA